MEKVVGKAGKNFKRSRTSDRIRIVGKTVTEIINKRLEKLDETDRLGFVKFGNKYKLVLNDKKILLSFVDVNSKEITVYFEKGSDGFVTLAAHMSDNDLLDAMRTIKEKCKGREVYYIKSKNSDLYVTEYKMKNKKFIFGYGNSMPKLFDILDKAKYLKEHTDEQVEIVLAETGEIVQ